MYFENKPNRICLLDVGCENIRKVKVDPRNFGLSNLKNGIPLTERVKFRKEASSRKKKIRILVSQTELCFPKFIC